MRRIAISFALVSALALPALAQGEITADTSLAREDRMVRSVFLEDLKAVVVAAGHTISSTGENGVNSVRAVNADGLIYHVNGTVCENETRPGCLGININVRYDGDSYVTYEKLNNANLMWAPVSVSLEGTIGTEGSTVIVSRYVILDGGMTMGNVTDNLTNALAIAPKAADYIWDAGEYAPGYDGGDEDWDDEDW